MDVVDTVDAVDLAVHALNSFLHSIQRSLLTTPYSPPGGVQFVFSFSIQRSVFSIDYSLLAPPPGGAEFVFAFSGRPMGSEP